MLPNDLDTQYEKERLAKAEEAAPAVVRILRTIGDEHNPPPGWQQRVHAELDRDQRKQRRDRIADYARGALIGLAAAAACIGILAWLGGWR